MDVRVKAFRCNKPRFKKEDGTFNRLWINDVSTNQVILVRENTVGTLAHELTHSFILDDTSVPKEDYHWNTGFYSGDTDLHGINARTAQRMDGSYSLLNADSEDALTNWMDDVRHGIALRTLSQRPIDPELVIVSGIIMKDGSLELLPARVQESGYLDPLESTGRFTIKTKNSAGLEIGSVGFNPVFVANVEGIRLSRDTIDLDGFPFAVAIPYSDQIATLTFTYDEKVLKVEDLRASGLRGLIDSIPDQAFKNAGQIRKKALLLQVDVFEKLISKENYVAAQAVLKSVKLELIKWLTDSYEISSPLQIDKSTALKQIALIERNVAANAKQRGHR